MKYGYSSKQPSGSSSNIKEFISQMQSRLAEDPFQKIEVKNNRASLGPRKEQNSREKIVKEMKEDYNQYRSAYSKPAHNTRVGELTSKPNFDYLFAQNYNSNKAQITE
jgi:hypothetical protein